VAPARTFIITGSVTAIGPSSDELGESDIDGASGRPVELDPGRGVGQDYAMGRGSVSAGMSSSAWAPRIAREGIKANTQL